jgi:hypothetical protein
MHDNAAHRAHSLSAAARNESCDSGPAIERWPAERDRTATTRRFGVLMLPLDPGVCRVSSLKLPAGQQPLRCSRPNVGPACMPLPFGVVRCCALTVLGPYTRRPPAVSTETKYAFNLTTAPDPLTHAMMLPTGAETSDHICVTFSDPNRVKRMSSGPARRVAAVMVR